jgi:thiol-disulfide isomerase/thioredoxin
MTRRFHWTPLLCGLLLCGLLSSPLDVANIARADDDAEKPKDEAAQTEAKDDASLADQIKENPNDVKLLNEYFSAEFGKTVQVISTDPDAALKAVEEMEAVLKDVEPTEAAAKQLLSRAERTMTYIRERVEIARTSMDELVAKLKEDPSDQKTLGVYRSKLMADIGGIARSEPAEAEKQLTAAKELLAELSDKTEDEAAKKSIEQTLKSLASIDRAITSAKKLMELVGKDSKDITPHVEAWVNGKPLEEGDLKGKVVLLDFWAVWCGPCVATFPHLREWQETYADKGLVIVGLTRYYKYQWDEEANRATSQKETTPEEEQKMLEKFAEEHDLQHRFAIQEGNELSEYYAVGGIPHVVVIDQEGKIRMVRVGSGTQNANDISELLAELLK